MTENLTSYVLSLCARIATHTDVPGTITRLFLSPATQAVHTLLRAEMQALGMSVRTDSVGNLRGLYPAAVPNAPTLLLGSHIDTVPNAGPYDGILGVAIPLALIKSLAGKRLPYAIELIAFSEEEGVRFKLPFIGSRALLGTLTPADLARTDAQGITLAEAIHNFGLNPDNISDALLTPGTLAFLEVHIEQGPVLESLNLPLGIVEAVLGQSRFELTFTGEANHAGTTPMHLRRDALAAAAAWLPSVESHASAIPELVATVGSIHASPGAANIIPGSVTLSLDIRHAEDRTRLEAAAYLLELAESLALPRGIAFAASETSSQPATPMHPHLRTLFQQSAAAANLFPHSMPSGAGHDAMILADPRVASSIPAAMLFLRSPNGLSHHPAEAVLPQDVTAALATLQHFLQTLTPKHLPPAPPS